jgi:hypothetical protein
MAKVQLSIPTGYESAELKAEQKRKLAQLMLEKGLNPSGNMQSWLQVLGSLSSTFAGTRLNKKADELDADTRTRMLADYTKASDSFNADAKALTPDDMVTKYDKNPWLQDDLKPYQDAIGEGLKEKEKIVSTPTSYERQGDLLGKPKWDPNASVIPTGTPGEYGPNRARVAEAMAAQGFGVGGNTTIRDPNAPNSMTGPGAAANGAPTAPAPGGIDLSLLSPQEKQIMQDELARRAAVKSGAFSPPHPNVPMGNPLTAQRAPAGVVNGKPYWMINGQPYDNPEGR